MAKPIFIIRIKVLHPFADDTVKHIRESVEIKELEREYFVLIVSTAEQEKDIEFEVLNSDKADEVTMEKVKEIELLITKNL